MNRGIIYRTCDRPKYMSLTFPHLIRNTQADVPIHVVENSSTQDSWEENLGTFEKYADDRCSIHIHKRRLGITHPIIVGIKHHEKQIGKDLRYILLVDDDILVPEPVVEGQTWDVVLSSMLEGPWDAAGLYYEGETLPGGEEKGLGLQRGVSHRFMAGFCAGFRLSLHKKNPLKDNGIASFNIWTSKIRCGWFSGYEFRVKEIDKRVPELSLRYDEYRDYSTHIEKMRGRELK